MPFCPNTAWNFEVEYADGSSQCQSRSEKWDFDNQLSYMFKEKPVLRAGDTMKIDCTYDNPTDQTVRYGERTDEEMCFSFTFGSITF